MRVHHYTGCRGEQQQRGAGTRQQRVCVDIERRSSGGRKPPPSCRSVLCLGPPRLASRRACQTRRRTQNFIAPVLSEEAAGGVGQMTD
ncbi:hypothetical protein E2C01_026989 [Portunus trituberculatus]|uniref:Uncharacterized protein n=1 Tax=Portunus trituberculatus TaxID=210409 RepID=A0A5B7EMK6_PORTR|nr:hypothetical protein [Portunus trituberculatus]